MGTLNRQDADKLIDAMRELDEMRVLNLTMDLSEQGVSAFDIHETLMEGIREVRANTATHPAFGEALEAAKAAGVRVLPLPCRVRPERLEIDEGKLPEILL